MTNEKKVALVTGASRGIGKAIAIELASSGYKVIINCSSSQKEAFEVLAEIEAAGGEGRVAKFDISDKEECKKEFDFISKNEKRLDVLVHNAGIRKDTLIMRMKDNDWDRVIDVNLTGFFNLAKHSSKLMLKNKWGRIVAISSTSGQAGVAGQVSYSASKAGVIGAVKALSKEVAVRNITVNAVAPGFIETDMTKDLGKEDISKTIPMQRFGTPKEVACVVDFLCSDSASYITGQVIGVNGGIY